MRRALGWRLRVAAAALTATERARPAEPHWYLADTGVDPSAQGKGLGGQLLRYRLDRCDTEGSAAYLESSKESNFAFYNSFGFEVIGEITLPGGGPPVWPTWRDPQIRR
ncbi:GNAT family N-acetyltransferase [Actinocrispum wychmicini]|uniref:Acetyltransferase (GNAT) family protein n=1 Tax=Actinocrispum wychmicini TaxID=1213861 RepID=A0A4R2JZ18_9PSEU|nr:GNAT family N-acetyltransferase [Actinocrispum wychmicini]TCO59365.1 acetyltransferase (GNAT) family protein [Actinocrispum wychmicini]